MNAKRRKQIEGVVTQLGSIEDSIASVVEEIQSIKEDEQEYYDNMPESLQGGEKGEAAQDAISNLEEAESNTENLDVASITQKFTEYLELLNESVEELQALDIETVKGNLEDAAGG